MIETFAYTWESNKGECIKIKHYQQGDVIRQSFKMTIWTECIKTHWYNLLYIILNVKLCCFFYLSTSMYNSLFFSLSSFFSQDCCLVLSSTSLSLWPFCSDIHSIPDYAILVPRGLKGRVCHDGMRICTAAFTVFFLICLVSKLSYTI